MQHRQLDHTAHTTTLQKFPLCYLAHDIEAPLNIGSFFRIADALGVERIFLTGTSPVPPNVKIRKTSRASEHYVPYSYERDPLVVIDQLRDSCYAIISLELTSCSIDLVQFNPDKNGRYCLILGSENGGVCQELLDLSDLVVHIPMLGHNSSMNVANACSIVTYEITRRLGA